MSNKSRATGDLEYLYSEIAEEGSAFIAFVYLQREYDWSLEKFEKLVRQAADDNLCAFELLVHDGKNREISASALDFSSPEGLRMVQFVPTDMAWGAYNRLFE